MRLRSEWLSAPALFLSASLGACQPKIGDDCKVSTECGVGSVSRVCDTTQPEGYCTIYNCEPGTCPSEAICVAFHVAVSAVPACAESQGSTRLARSFCLRRCESDSDCRKGYVCPDLSNANNPWQASVLESGGDVHACVPPYSGVPVASDANTGVCEGHRAPLPDVGAEAGTGGASAGGSPAGGTQPEGGGQAGAAEAGGGLTAGTGGEASEARAGGGASAGSAGEPGGGSSSVESPAGAGGTAGGGASAS